MSGAGAREKLLSEIKVCDEVGGSRDFARDLLRRVGDKWSLPVIAALARGSFRFTELQRALPGISHRMLTVTLRSLATDGLVHREAFGEVPPRVEYSLTPRGETLLEPVLALIEWAGRNREEIQGLREGAPPPRPPRS